MSKILIINAGSSSLKFAVINSSNLEVIADGIAERIGLEMSNVIVKYEGKHETKLKLDNHRQAVDEILRIAKEVKLITDLKEITHVGFRIVVGGPTIHESTVVDEKIINIIEDNIIYAPLHNPGALQAIRAFKEILPHAYLSATYDTAFHNSMPRVNYSYPVPKKWSQEYGVRKFGMHGTSHQYVSEKMQEILGKDKINIVNLHIGNGASLCAIKDSKSIDTSMGMTPLAGVMMGTRSGDIDPSIIEFVAKLENKTASQVTDALNKESGLKGVSNLTSDMRDIEVAAASGNADAAFSLELYAKYSADYLINYLNKIGPNIDAITFTAGVGENAANYRQSVIDLIKILNIKLNPELNKIRSGEPRLISSKDSAIKVYVVPTNEEYMIARDALRLHPLGK